jgi:hypothetical protein
MNAEDLQKLEREVAKAKRIASEWASKLHDLVEDRLPAAYLEIPEISQGTFDACQAWAEVSDRLKDAKKTLSD